MEWVIPPGGWGVIVEKMASTSTLWAKKWCKLHVFGAGKKIIKGVVVNQIPKSSRIGRKLHDRANFFLLKEL